MSTFTQLVDKARDFACELYRVQPKPLIDNPFAQALRMPWDELCKDHPPGLPPLPESPFEGGQCCGTFYDVYGFVTFPGNPNNGVEQKLGSSKQGTVVGIEKFVTGGGGSNGYRIRHKACNGTSYVTEVLSVGVGSNPQGVTISRVVPLYGNSDNCGNPPEQYPDAPPVPPGGYNSPPVTVNLNDGDETTVVFNITPPTINLPAVRFPDIVVNVISPQFNVPISFGYGGNVSIGTPSIPPASLPPEFQEDFDKLKDDFTDFKEDWDFEFDPLDLEFYPDIEKEDSLIADGGKEEDKPGLVGVTVTLSKKPDKAQFGTPPVYFAGWVTFVLQGGYTERSQINFERSYFPAPNGSTGYGVTLTNGAEGDIQVYSRVAEEG